MYESQSRVCFSCGGVYGADYDEHTGSDQHRRAVAEASGRCPGHEWRGVFLSDKLKSNPDYFRCVFCDTFAFEPNP